eukprot:13182595-Alexandrium_andersonii.AAC.1
MGASVGVGGRSSAGAIPARAGAGAGAAAASSRASAFASSGAGAAPDELDRGAHLCRRPRGPRAHPSPARLGSSGPSARQTVPLRAI